jgi:hypothetical protein
LTTIIPAEFTFRHYTCKFPVTLSSYPLESVTMNDRYDQKEQPIGGHLRLCQHIAELEGIAGQLEIDAEELPGEAQPCTLAEAINDGLAMIYRAFSL